MIVRTRLSALLLDFALAGCGGRKHELNGEEERLTSLLLTGSLRMANDFQKQLLRFAEPGRFFQSLQYVPLGRGIACRLQKPRQAIVRISRVGRIEQKHRLVSAN